MIWAATKEFAPVIRVLGIFVTGRVYGRRSNCLEVIVVKVIFKVKLKGEM
jgi:hypothetical protein